MKRILFFIISICLLASCTKDPEILNGQIMGTVTEAANDGVEPLSGVTVKLTDNGISMVTGSDGHFVFQDLEAGSYKLQFSKNGYTTDYRTVNVVAAQVSQCNIQLKSIKKDLIEIEPSNLDFGSNISELSTIVKNNGHRDLEWSLDLGDNGSWLKVSPQSGRLSSGKEQTLVFNINRDHFTDNKNAVVKFRAGGSSFPINITASYKGYQPQMLLEPANINFGTELVEQNLKIKNIGSAPLKWSIKNPTESCLTVSEKSGTIVVDGSKVVSVKLDRSRMKNDLSTSIIVSDGSHEETVNVTAQFVAKKGELLVTPTILDFEGDKTQLPLTIENTGNASMDWTISDVKSGLALSSTSGTLRAGANTVIYVTLDRENMAESYNSQFTVSDGLSKQVVMVSAYQAKAIMNISPKTLDFGESLDRLSFTISNYGNTDLNWQISDISDEALSIVSKEGRLSPKGQTQVSVNLDRSRMTQYLNATITVTDGRNAEVIHVNAQKGQVEDPVPMGLGFYYKFDGNFDDSSENSVHGTGYNDPAFVEGVTGGSKAIQFSKMKNSTFTVPYPIIDSRNMTISFWVKNVSDGHIFHMISKYGEEPIFSLSMVSGNLKFVVSRYNNTYTFNDRPSFNHPTITDGKWHHIVLTSDFNKTSWSNTTTKLFVDGRQVDVLTENGNSFSEEPGSNQASYGTGTKFIMGGDLNSMKGNNMMIDNFRVYDTRQLSNDEIEKLYRSKQ